MRCQRRAYARANRAARLAYARKLYRERQAPARNARELGLSASAGALAADLAAYHRRAQRREARAAARKVAVEFLSGQLARGPRDSRDVKRAAVAAGITNTYLRHACARLGVVIEPLPGKPRWSTTWTKNGNNLPDLAA